MTTAFKMDEQNFPMIQSSVPSDRYYDCPDLRFELIARDSTDRLLSYFNLACDSPQQLAPAFYSGRIRYPEQLGGDKYEGIARYLEKVVAERGKVDQLDCLVTYAGDGYNSDCLVCWMDERIALDENFPLTNTRKAENLRQLNFRMDDYMKYRVFDELVRPEVDAMFFNEHGSPDKQHVGNYKTEPDSFEGQYSQLKAEIAIALYMERRKGEKADMEGAKQYFKEKYHLTDAFFEEKEKDDDAKAKGRPDDHQPRRPCNAGDAAALRDAQCLLQRVVPQTRIHHGILHLRPGPHGGHAGQYGQRAAGPLDLRDGRPAVARRARRTI